MNNVFKNKWFFFFLLVSNVYLILSYFPMGIFWMKTPKDSYFPLYNVESSYDYNGYLAAITMGQDGYWYFRNPYSTEKSYFTLYYLPYIILGKVSKITQLSSPLTYHLGNIFFAECYFFGIFFLMATIFGKNKFSFFGSLFAVLITITLPTFFLDNNENIFYNKYWWHLSDAINRLNEAPHHTLGNALFLFSFAYLIKWFRSKEKKHMFISILCAFFTSIIFPPTVIPFLFTLYFVVCVYTVLVLFKNKPFTFSLLKNKLSKHQAKLGFLLALSGGIGISYIQSRIGYGKNAWVDWEILRWNNLGLSFDINFIFLFLPAILFSLPILFVKKTWKNSYILILLLWAVMPILLLPFSNILSYCKVRLSQGVPFIPYAILSALSLKNLDQTKRPKWLSVVYIVFFIFYATTVSLFILDANSMHHIHKPVDTRIQYPKPVAEGLKFIQTNIKKDSVILSDEYMSVIIPGFAPVISYWGHINLTIDFGKKQNLTKKFFSHQFDEIQAGEFLRKNNISWIYFGPDEKNLGFGDLTYPFLKKAFTYGDVEIFSVAKFHTEQTEK